MLLINWSLIVSLLADPLDVAVVCPLALDCELAVLLKRGLPPPVDILALCGVRGITLNKSLTQSPQPILLLTLSAYHQRLGADGY